MLSRIHVFVSGRVQGVAFRYFAQRRANELTATGWVKNLYDGRVEIVAEGPKDSLEKLIEHFRQGPRLARVDNLDIRWEEALGEFDDFKVEFSAF